jgi:hypothetical protein
MNSTFWHSFEHTTIKQHVLQGGIVQQERKDHFTIRYCSRSASGHLGSLRGKLLRFYDISVPYCYDVTCIQQMRNKSATHLAKP